MRAQSAVGVLPYDAFLFMGLQNLLADRLGVLSGAYRHNAGTFHLYETEMDTAARVAEEEIIPISVGPIDSSERQLEDIYAFELELRRATLGNDRGLVESLISDQHDTAKFWGTAKVVLLLHSLRRLGMWAEAKSLNAQLPADLRKLDEQHSTARGTEHKTGPSQRP
jgi:hypothetical protein